MPTVDLRLKYELQISLGISLLNHFNTREREEVDLGIIIYLNASAMLDEKV